jgi:putative Holliday junction resolvase
MQPQTKDGTILALDVGERRIGVASASTFARLPSPLLTLERRPQTMEDIKHLVGKEQAIALVIGLPRGLNGQHTAQTAVIEQFFDDLGKVVDVPLHWQDEAVTSRKAEAELEARGKPYKKGDIDALSATYILEDYLRDNYSKRGEA